MRKYRVRIYDKFGNLKNTYTENLSSSFGSWVQSKKMDERDGAKVRLYSKSTADGHNRVCTGYYAKDRYGRITFTLENKKAPIRRRKTRR